MSIATTEDRIVGRSTELLGPVPKWVIGLVCMDLALGVANVLTFVISRALNLEPNHLFRVSNEANIPTWWSSAQLLMIGVVFAALAFFRFDRRDRRTWALWLPALFFMFLSMDEVASIHEQIGEHYGSQSLRTGTWVAICVPIFLVGLGIVARAIWPFLRGHTEAIRLFALGMGIFVISAVGIELLTNIAPDGHWIANGINLVEEVGEMIGASIVLWGAVVWARSLGLRLKMEHRNPARGV